MAASQNFHRFYKTTAGYTAHQKLPNVQLVNVAFLVSDGRFKSRSVNSFLRTLRVEIEKCQQTLAWCFCGFM